MKFYKLTSRDYFLIFVTFILTSIFSPIGNNITQIGINLFSSMSNGFSNFYYYTISLNDSNLVTNSLSLQFICVMLCVCYYLYKDMSNSYSNLENKLNELKEKIKPSELKKKVEYNIEEEVERINIIMTSSKRNVSITKYLLIIFSSLYLSYYLFQVNIHNKNIFFNNRLEVISPYIEQKQIVELKSDWARMRNVNDYNRIQERIKSVYKVNGITE